jgi:hypothetical protein
MQPLIENPRQRARSLSAQLGALAAQNAAAPALPRIIAILQHLRERQRTREDVAAKLRANEFILDG